jgi:hypothetical protein
VTSDCPRGKAGAYTVSLTTCADSLDRPGVTQSCYPTLVSRYLRFAGDT